MGVPFRILIVLKHLMFRKSIMELILKKFHQMELSLCNQPFIEFDMVFPFTIIGQCPLS